MTLVGWLQIALTLALVVVCAIPLSRFIAGVYAGERNFLTPVVGPVERAFYRLAGVDPAREQDWFAYTVAMFVFSVAGFLSLYALQRLQNFLPLNPRDFDAVAPDLAFNTSSSFITNTNWQNYSGETTMSHLTQMLGLTVHNFLSAATGLAMAFALVRGFARSSAATVGNFWVDLMRVTLYILLPISIVGALVFVALGMPQTLSGAVDATTLEGAKQTISIGPVASQEIIKELGTNGGGFFNANSSHPFENPNAWTNLLEIWALLLIPTASVLAFGRVVGDVRQGWAILAAMAVFLLVGLAVVYWSEASGNPDPYRAGRRSVVRQHGGQGGPLRPSDVEPVHHRDDRHQYWRRQLDDRLLYAVRWARADVQPARRLHLAGRRRSRPVRLPGRRDHRGVRRGADGRPHARISRQEDRGAGDEVRDARGAHLSADRARFHRRVRAAPRRSSSRSSRSASSCS
jgi:K+-transporting ATPase KdpA subunit